MLQKSPVTVIFTGAEIGDRTRDLILTIYLPTHLFPILFRNKGETVYIFTIFLAAAMTYFTQIYN